jgi:hypothetical protein
MNRRTMAVAAGVVGALLLSACSGMTAAAEVAQAPEGEQSLEIWQRKGPGSPSDRIGPEVGMGIVLVAAALAMLPSIIAFLAFQRSFMRGISAGAIKG